MKRIIEIEGGKYSAVINYRENFKQFLLKKNMFNDLEKSSEPEKRKTFLWWKHGLCDRANSEIEQTDKEICGRFKNFKEADFLKLPPGVRWHIKNKIVWNDYCQILWQDIQSGYFFKKDYMYPVWKEWNVPEIKVETVTVID